MATGITTTTTTIPVSPLKEKVGVFVQFRNAQQNKLGMPLPAGTIRLYKKDGTGNQQFIGETRSITRPRMKTCV